MFYCCEQYAERLQEIIGGLDKNSNEFIAFNQAMAACKHLVSTVTANQQTSVRGDRTAHTDTVEVRVVVQREDRSAHIGFSIGSLDDGTLVVAQVYPNGPANGYLFRGDVLLAIDGVPTSSTTQQAVLNMLDTASTTVEVLVQRVQTQILQRKAEGARQFLARVERGGMHDDILEFGVEFATCVGGEQIVSKIEHGAAVTGSLQEGDIVVTINGTHVEHMPHDLMMDDLCSGASYEIVVERYIDALDHTETYIPMNLNLTRDELEFVQRPRLVERPVIHVSKDRRLTLYVQQSEGGATVGMHYTIDGTEPTALSHRFTQGREHNILPNRDLIIKAICHREGYPTSHVSIARISQHHSSIIAQINTDVRTELGNDSSIKVDLENGGLEMLSPIQFETKKHALRSHGGANPAMDQGNEDILAQVARALTAIDRVAREWGLPPAKFLVEGHTNSSNETHRTDIHQQQLSEDRADACEDELVARGVPKAMLEAKGFGGTRRKYEGTPEENTKNQRVTISLLNGDALLAAAASLGRDSAVSDDTCSGCSVCTNGPPIMISSPAATNTKGQLRVTSSAGLSQLSFSPSNERHGVKSSLGYKPLASVNTVRSPIIITQSYELAAFSPVMTQGGNSSDSTRRDSSNYYPTDAGGANYVMSPPSPPAFGIANASHSTPMQIATYEAGNTGTAPGVRTAHKVAETSTYYAQTGTSTQSVTYATGANVQTTTFPSSTTGGTRSITYTKTLTGETAGAIVYDDSSDESIDLDSRGSRPAAGFESDDSAEVDI